MKTKYASLTIAALVVGIGVSGQASLAQLPPTNMGKFVHQPGDNQYSPESQTTRHPVSKHSPVPVRATAPVAQHVAPLAVVPTGATMGGGVKFRTDISIEPIATDEPIPDKGFPPLPDRADFPGSSGPAWSSNSGGYGSRSTNTSAQAGGASGSEMQGMHQHYAHYQPGAFGGAPTHENSAPTQSRSSGYKCRTADAPIVSGSGHTGTNGASRSGGGSASSAGGSAGMLSADTFSSSGAPAYRGVSPQALGGLGKAPRLDDSQDLGGGPEAPQPAIVNQSTTQDLSLPDDQAISKNSQNDGKGRRFVENTARRIKSAGMQVLQRAVPSMPISF